MRGIIVNIKQQKQIRTFLIDEYGENKGNTLFNNQEIILKELIENTKNKSKRQMKMLTQTILPRIALYKALLKDGFLEDDIYYLF